MTLHNEAVTESQCVDDLFWVVRRQADTNELRREVENRQPALAFVYRLRT